MALTDIIVLVSDRCLPEVRYTFTCLLKHFLGLEYEVRVDPAVDNFLLDLGGKTVEIESIFFESRELVDLLDEEHLPTTVVEKDVKIGGSVFPITALYGVPDVAITEDRVSISFDLIASTFFMLSRWEESVSKPRDQHGRFPAAASIAHQYGFLKRPIVNEYVELLWECLLAAGYKGPRRTMKFEILPTHDVDTPYLWSTYSSKLKSLASSVIRHKNMKMVRSTFSHLAKNKDPFDTYDLMMNMSEDEGVKSHFFFMSGGTSAYDNRYGIEQSRISSLIEHIKCRGHSIGIHPSYNAYNDVKQFKKEKERLENAVDLPIEVGRNHYLRYDIVKTPMIWEEMEMKWDSTLAYADHSGFRCGVCYEFPMYSLSSRKELKLRQRPLIHMEASLINYEQLSKKDAIAEVCNTKDVVKKYGGLYVFLWHNSSFYTPRYEKMSGLLDQMYKTYR